MFQFIIIEGTLIAILIVEIKILLKIPKKVEVENEEG